MPDELSAQDKFWVHLMLDDVSIQEFIDLLAGVGNLRHEGGIALNLVDIYKNRRMKGEQISAIVIKTMRERLMTMLDDRTRAMLKTVEIERIEPFYINLTVPKPDLKAGFQATPTVLLERGTTPRGAYNLLSKMYDPELVKYITERLSEEHFSGVGRIWKVMLAKLKNGRYSVHVLEATEAELKEHQASRALRRKKR